MLSDRDQGHTPPTNLFLALYKGDFNILVLCVLQLLVYPLCHCLGQLIKLQMTSN